MHQTTGRAWQIPQLYANLTRNQNPPRPPDNNATRFHLPSLRRRQPTRRRKLRLLRPASSLAAVAARRPPFLALAARPPRNRRRASAILVALLETALSLTILTLPLLAISALLLTWSYLAADTGGQERP